MRETIVAQFTARLGASSGDVACLTKRGGTFSPTTWSELAEDVCRLAAGLQEWGIQADDRVIQLSENRYEWIIADLAIQALGAIHVPVHAPLAGPQIAYQIEHSGARLVLLSSPTQATKLADINWAKGHVERVLSYEQTDVQLGGQPVDLLETATVDCDPQRGHQILTETLGRTKPDQPATILYTSGTTGHPKGVVLSHRNIVSNTLASLQAFQEHEDDLRLCFLPLSHIYARTCDLYTWICGKAKLALAESRDTVLADCANLRPTLLNGVPYFYEKVCRYLTDQGLADVAGSLLKLLGGNVRNCCAGGAALPNHVFDFFQNQQLPMLQGYGLTEASPVLAMSSETTFRRGSVGKAPPGVEIAIADDGEILARGPNIMLGYYRNDEATAATVKDGWLYTGDIGYLDEDNFLFITGRKKEIIVTSGGKNITPVMIESLLTEDPLIEQAMVVGDGRSYLTALIVPSSEAMKAVAEAIGLDAGVEGFLENHKLHEVFEGRIQQRLAVVSKYECVGKFTLLSRPFTVDSGEMTPKMSLRRDIILRNYAHEIEAMY